MSDALGTTGDEYAAALARRSMELREAKTRGSVLEEAARAVMAEAEAMRAESRRYRQECDPDAAAIRAHEANGMALAGHLLRARMEEADDA